MHFGCPSPEVDSWGGCRRYREKMSGQTLTDRIAAAQYQLTGSEVARVVCKATTHEVMAPKKKHLDCKWDILHSPSFLRPGAVQFSTTVQCVHYCVYRAVSTALCIMHDLHSVRLFATRCNSVNEKPAFLRCILYKEFSVWSWLKANWQHRTWPEVSLCGCIVSIWEDRRKSAAFRQDREATKHLHVSLELCVLQEKAFWIINRSAKACMYYLQSQRWGYRYANRGITSLVFVCEYQKSIHQGIIHDA